MNDASHLHVGFVQGRSVVLGARSRSPLKLLTPRNHGHAAWAYQSSYGGGLVGTDCVNLSVRVDPGASLFLSTQASGKVYREARSTTTLDAVVGDGALFVNWPDPVVCFEGAGLVQRQHVRLASHGSLLHVEAFTSGRAARAERWAFEHLESRLSLDLEERPVLREALRLSKAHGALPARLSTWDAFATVVLCGPQLDEVSAAVEAKARALPPGIAATSRGAWGVLLRLAAPEVGALILRLRELVGSSLQALLGDDPLSRKW